MKRTYAAARLLEHGPLTFGEFVSVTGWGVKTAEFALRELRASGTVAVDRLPPVFRGSHLGNYVYRLAADRAGEDDGAAYGVREAGIAGLCGSGSVGLREAGPVGACGPSGVAGCGDSGMDGGATCCA